MRKKTGDRESTSRKPAKEVMVLTELDQIRVLAHALRIRILEELGEERTVKQVALRLGENPTKLYHHVEALRRVGLIELTRTRQKRGTLEKYYLAAAQTFRTDSRVFSRRGVGGEREALQTMVSTIFDTTSAEVLKLLADAGTECVEERGLVRSLEVRASKKELEELRNRLHGILESLTSVGHDQDEADQERFRLTLAYFPLEPPEKGRPESS